MNAGFRILLGPEITHGIEEITVFLALFPGENEPSDGCPGEPQYVHGVLGWGAAVTTGRRIAPTTIDLSRPMSIALTLSTVKNDDFHLAPYLARCKPAWRAGSIKWVKIRN